VVFLPVPEFNLMNFILPFSLANPAQDRKTIRRDEMTSKKWWEDGPQNWSGSEFKKRRTAFISFLDKIEDLITKETTRFKKPNPTLKTVFVFRLDINLETNYSSVSTSSRRADRRISQRRILLHNSSSHRIYT
ncbi:MAG: hypothetical protein N4A59_08895, partial [Marinifilum sp.]|nr:hypothetical protein [Marinifilum sp.]